MLKLLFAAIELRRARIAMRKNPSLATIARFSKADWRYYELRHPDAIKGIM